MTTPQKLPRRQGERGLAMMSLLAMIFVLTTLATLVLYLSGKETALSAIRLSGAESLYVAEGGAFSGRAALMAYMNAWPLGSTSVDPSLSTTTALAWYAGGSNASQNPLALLDYLVTDGKRFTLGATNTTPSETFQVNWASGYPHLKLQVGGTPTNAIGAGAYTASLVLQPNPTVDTVSKVDSCNPAGSKCSIQQRGTNWYEIYYTYTITSDGQLSPKFRRRIALTGNFTVQLKLQSFSMYALFTDTHTTPGGSPIWFTNNTSFNGPVHTNGEFRFAFFPTFTGKVESVNSMAWFNNTGSPLELSNNENVSSGTRIDAPLVPPDPDPQAAAPANFTRGAPAVPLPSSPFSQQGVAVGRNPTDTSAVTTAQITGAIPELTGSSTVPTGIFVPVVDANGNCRSDPFEQMAGGIYVQGDLNNMTMSVSGSTAVYTLVQGSVTTTVTVDRAGNQTTVSSNGWLPPPCPGIAPGPASRVFTGVPKGWQGPGNPNASMIFVNGNINALSGTLQQNEQTTIAATGSITITGNVQYQTPPNPADPTSNPTNVLGIYSSGGDIVVGPSAPNDLIIQGVLMAGNSASSYNSSVRVAGYNTGSPRGNVNLLGGIIEKFYGPFGTFNPSTGTISTGYGRAFTYDTRMSRGFTPPYFPTTNLFVVSDDGQQPLAGRKPTWREATPP